MPAAAPVRLSGVRSGVPGFAEFSRQSLPGRRIVVYGDYDRVSRAPEHLHAAEAEARTAMEAEPADEVVV